MIKTKLSCHLDAINKKGEITMKKANLLNMAEKMTALSGLIAFVVGVYWSVTFDVVMPSNNVLVNLFGRGVLIIAVSVAVVATFGGILRIIEIEQEKKEMS